MPMRQVLEPIKRRGQESRNNVGKDVVSVSAVLKEQSRAIKAYRADGHKKTMLAMSETVESLRHVMQMLEDGDHSAVLWCGFVCILGFCVSMLFIMNGMLLIVIAARIGLQKN